MLFEKVVEMINSLVSMGLRYEDVSQELTLRDISVDGTAFDEDLLDFSNEELEDIADMWYKVAYDVPLCAVA